MLGRKFLMIEIRQCWGEDRVFFSNDKGELFYIPVGWTDVLSKEPYALIAEGNAFFRAPDLLELSRLVTSLTQKKPPLKV